MRPVVSIVTWTWIGHLAARRRPSPAGTPTIAALAWSRSKQRLDEEEVDAALEQAVRLLLVGVAQVGEADLAERRELGARARWSPPPTGPAAVRSSTRPRWAMRAPATLSS